jgi:hypothetical protein
MVVDCSERAQDLCGSRRGGRIPREDFLGNFLGISWEFLRRRSAMGGSGELQWMAEEEEEEESRRLCAMVENDVEVCQRWWNDMGIWGYGDM